MQSKTKRTNRKRRHARVRAKIRGTSEIPRISVFRSNRHIFVQLVDDKSGKTIVSNGIKPNKKDTKKKTKIEQATAIGEALAKKARDAGVGKVVFDRGGYAYHGRVKALAEGLRKGGLKF